MVRFLIGTQSVKSENSIHCVEYDEESVLVSKGKWPITQISVVGNKIMVNCGSLLFLVVYSHPLGEIWQTNAHPNRIDVVGTVHSKNIDRNFTIW